MLRWALLLVSSVGAADPITVTVGGGWRASAGKTDLSKSVPIYGDLDAGKQQGDLGTFDVSVLARLSPTWSVGLHVTTSSQVNGEGAVIGNSFAKFDDLMLRPVTIAAAGQYELDPFWVMPWFGCEVLHARYDVSSDNDRGAVTREHHNEWDNNGAVVGLAVGIDLAGNDYLTATMFVEAESVVLTGTGNSDLPYWPFIDSAITFGFGVRYR